MNREWRHDGCVISNDASRLHLETIRNQESAVFLMQ
jgi:hypothetical protein